MKGFLSDWSDMAFPTDSEITTVTDLRDALKPVEVLTKILCQEHVTLTQADRVFSGAFSAMGAQNTHISDLLKEALQKRYSERKNTNLLAVMSFLSDPHDYEFRIDGPLTLHELKREVKALCSRLGLASDEEPEPEMEQEEDEPVSEPGQRTEVNYADKLAQQLLKRMNTKKKRKQTIPGDVDEDISEAIRRNILSERLQKLAAALDGVQASSVEAERAFSTAGRILTKIRNRLGDDTVDFYCFANHFLKKQDRQTNH